MNPRDGKDARRDDLRREEDGEQKRERHRRRVEARVEGRERNHHDRDGENRQRVTRDALTKGGPHELPYLRR